MFTLKPIGEVHTPYTERSEVPRRPEDAEAECTIEIEEQYEEGLKDVEGFSYIYVLCYLDRIDTVELTAYPPLDGKPHGVFSTRSPFRPNPISLSRVRLIRRDGTRLTVAGLDLLDRTPVIDIKPYSGRVPKEEGLRFGWLEEVEENS